LSRRATSGERPATRRWLAPVVLGLTLVALLNIVLWGSLAARWTDARQAGLAEAAAAFSAARGATGEQLAYLWLDGAGSVHVRRDLEGPDRIPLRHLHVLAWEPTSKRLVRVDLPFWFVRLKTMGPMNLGSLTGAVAGDWGSLGLRVTEDDLERRGPALVLDEARPDGARILVWTE
jgi:hypothetical protein